MKYNALLEGLEAVELRLSLCKSLIDFRIDANTYKKEYLKTDFLIKSKNPISIENLSKSVQNFGAYSLCNFINFRRSGIPFLMTENIRHNFIDWNIQKYVDDESHKMLYKSHCTKGQLLITMAGEYLGRVAVYDKDFICSSNQAIAKVTLKDNINPYMVSTFLNSTHGQNQINRFRTITGQPNINMSLIKSLVIPTFSEKFELEIEYLLKCFNKKLEQSKTLYKQSEEILLKELDLLDFEPTKENIAIKSFSESFGESGRLDSEYYLPMYDEVIARVKKVKYDTLLNIVSINKSVETGSDAYRESGIEYIRVSNLYKMGLTQSKIFLDNDFFDEAKLEELKPKRDTVLLSKDGTIGIAYAIKNETNIVTSGAILHLAIRDKEQILSEYLTLVLNSLIVQMQSQRDAGGSIIKHWKPSEIGEVLIPIIDYTIQTQIEEKIKESFRLKEESKRLLEVAKKAVEMAIEEGEDLAMRFISLEYRVIEE